jgi:EpsI family protein
MFMIKSMAQADLAVSPADERPTPRRMPRVGVVLASIAILTAALLAHLLVPRELMARSSATLDLQQVIPNQFGNWKLLPNLAPVPAAEPEGFVETETNSARIYSQEVGRGYTDNHGNVVMLMVAYGPVQNYRLKAHRPEICYTAAGFRISNQRVASVSWRDGAQPIKTTRLIAERESRFEPVTYWMRVGNDIATGVIDRQIIRLQYGLRGIIPDGALVRVSTVGLAEDSSFKVQDQFIRELLAAIPARDLKFFTGTP